MEERFRIATKYGPHLWTRELARKIRTEVTAMLERLDPGGTLVVDLQGVEAFDFSFANELFGRTLMELPRVFPGRFVVIENLTSYTRENLASALKGLGLVAIERRGRDLHLVGDTHPVDVQTFAAVFRARKPVTAADLSKRLKVNLTAVNERLSKLTDLGLVRRDSGLSAAGRRQYEYTVLG